MKRMVIIALLLASAAMCSAATESYYFFVFSNPVAGHDAGAAYQAFSPFDMRRAVSPPP